MPSKRVLLVEGSDDEHVLKHLCGQRGVQELDEIVSLGGAERLLESFPVRVKASKSGDAIGVIVDADTSANARWCSLRSRLVDAGYPAVPINPDPAGTIIEPPSTTLLPRVGIWIMPDNQTAGILEDFLRFLVPEHSPLFRHVESSVANIPATERRFSELAKSKAIIHTWLAWQIEPGKPLGTAITAKFLDSRVKEVDILITWLNRLYYP